MLIDYNSYVNTAIIDQVTKELRSIIANSDIDELTANAIRPDNYYWPGIDDVSVHGSMNQDTFILGLYHAEGITVNEFNKDKYESVIKLIPQINGLESLTVSFIAPKSIITKHVDDYDSPVYSKKVVNIVVGIQVPTDDSDIVGIQIEDYITHHTTNIPVTFNPQIPHWGWNHSNEWWIFSIIVINSTAFNNEDLNS